jgi:hypothetical protein
MSQPRISDDGKFYWDGARWVPMVPAASKEPISVQVRGQMPAWAAIGGLILCMPIGLVMVGFTPWKVTTKLVVAAVGIVGWLIIGGAITRH